MLGLIIARCRRVQYYKYNIKRKKIKTNTKIKKNYGTFIEMT